MVYHVCLVIRQVGSINSRPGSFTSIWWLFVSLRSILERGGTRVPILRILVGCCLKLIAAIKWRKKTAGRKDWLIGWVIDGLVVLSRVVVAGRGAGYVVNRREKNSSGGGSKRREKKRSLIDWLFLFWWKVGQWLILLWSRVFFFSSFLFASSVRWFGWKRVAAI